VVGQSPRRSGDTSARVLSPASKDRSVLVVGGLCRTAVRRTIEFPFITIGAYSYAGRYQRDGAGVAGSRQTPGVRTLGCGVKERSGWGNQTYRVFDGVDGPATSVWEGIFSSKQTEVFDQDDRKQCDCKVLIVKEKTR
jgi:hypothetical protein